MKRTKLIFGSIAAVIAVHNASAHEPKFAEGRIFACPMPSGFSAAKTWDELPPILREKFKDIAPLGEDWNPSDVMDSRQTSGVEFVIHKRNRWIISIGRGGIGTWLETVAYDLTPDKSNASEVPKVEIKTQNTCSFVEQFSRAQ